MNPGYPIAVLSVLLASVSQILLKKSAKKEYDGFLRQYLNPLVIIGYGLTFLSMLLTMFAYRYLPYKNIPVLESLGILFVTVFGRAFFKEPIHKKKILGIAVLFCGILLYYM